MIKSHLLYQLSYAATSRARMIAKERAPGKGYFQFAASRLASAWATSVVGARQA